MNPYYSNSRVVPGIPGYAEEEGGEARGSNTQGIVACSCLLVRGAVALRRVPVACAGRLFERRAPVLHWARKEKTAQHPAVGTSVPYYARGACCPSTKSRLLEFVCTRTTDARAKNENSLQA